MPTSKEVSVNKQKKTPVQKGEKGPMDGIIKYGKTAGTAAGTIHPIVSEGHPALRQMSEEVPLSEITGAKIQGLIADMKKSLASQDDGIGLAAPQIGVPLRIFIVSKKIFHNHEGDEIKAEKAAINATTTTNSSTEDSKVANTNTTDTNKPKVVTKNPALDDLVFINPTITKYSKEKKWMDGEGCLSMRWVYGKVQRSTKVTIRAYDEKGRVFERGAGGLLAHIFQHEVDHLNGILFIDKAKDLEEVEPAEAKKSKKVTK